MKLDDMVAVVTGGAQGIGARIVQELLHGGASVVIADIDEMRANLWMNEAEQNGFGENRLRFRECDVRDAVALENTLQEAKEWKGRLDIIVNSAGIFNKQDYRARTAIQTKLCAIMDTYYMGTELMSNKKGGNGGVIVTIGATCGLRIEKGMPAFHTACETGVVAFTRAVALNSAGDDNGIRINCICPTSVETKNAKYNWDRRPSTQAHVDQIGTVGIDEVVKAFVQVLDKTGTVLEVSKEKGIVAV